MIIVATLEEEWITITVVDVGHHHGCLRRQHGPAIIVAIAAVNIGHRHGHCHCRRQRGHSDGSMGEIKTPTRMVRGGAWGK